MAAKFFDHLLNQIGLPISNATVTVRVADATPGAGALATIWSGDGTPVISGSTLTTDAKGYFEFWAADGKYDLTVTGTGLTTRIFADVEVADVSERNAADADWKIGTATVNTVNFDNTSSDITLSRVAANILATGSGDSFAADTLLLDRTNRDVSLTRSAANTLQLATGDKLVAQNVNNIRYANEFAGADAGAKIAAAVTDLPTTGGIVNARGLEGTQTLTSQTLGSSTKPVTLLLGAATFTLASGSITVPRGSSIVGLGPHATIIEYSGTSDAIRWTDSATPSDDGAGEMRGFRINGHSATGATSSGIHLGDIVGARIQDVSVGGFDAAGQTGVWVDNVLAYTERTHVSGLNLESNTVGLRFTVNGGANSFGFNKFFDVRASATAGQTGVSVENTGVLYGGILMLNCNVADAGTVLGMTGTAQIQGQLVHLTGEQTSGAGGTSLSIGATNIFKVSGATDFDNLTSSINASATYSVSLGWDGTDLHTIGRANVNQYWRWPDANPGSAFARNDQAALSLGLMLENRSLTATTDHGAKLRWDFATNASQTGIEAGSVSVAKEQLWTSTAATQDAYMKFETAINGAATEQMRLDSARILLASVANLVEQYNSTNAQTFNLYNTRTDASNYERAIFSWVGNELRISTAAAGTGTARAITIFPTGSGVLTLGSAGAEQWRLDANGHLIALADNTKDIGASGATRPRDLFLGRDATLRRVKSSGTALVAGDFVLSAGWGTTATVGTLTGTDTAWQITVTSSGTGQGANPTITLTFKDGTFTNAPICISKMVGGTGTVTNLTEAPTATTNVITFVGTPVAASTYIIAGHTIGR